MKRKSMQIDSAFNNLPLRAGAPLHLILVTDEDRYIVNHNLNFNSTLDDLFDHNATLHSLLDVVITAGGVTDALGLNGLDATDAAFFADGSGGYTAGASGDTVFTPRPSPGENDFPFEDYGTLALATGGSVWDLNPLEQDANSRASFSNAFVDVIANQIEQQAAISVFSTDPAVEVQLLSLTTVNGILQFEVEFTGDGQPHSFDLQFVRAADPGVLLGSVPVTIATSYRYDVDAIDPDNDVLTYQLLGDTHGATIDSETGLLTWGVVDAGSYAFTAHVTDGRGGSDTQTLTVQVGVTNENNNDPTITPLDTITTEAKRAVTVRIDATDIDGDQLRYLLVDDPANGAPLPAGVAIDSDTGQLDWAPTLDNIPTHNVKVLVIDGHGGQATTTVVIEVTAPTVFHNHSPDIISIAPKSAQVDETYFYPVRGIDLDGDPLVYDLSVAPDGMVIDPASGKIAWRPTTAQLGAETVIVRVRDNQGGVGLQAFEIVVTSVNDAPAITSSPGGPVATGEAWEYQVTATDPNGDVLSYTLAAPAATGATISETTGLIQWTPASAGDYRFLVTADDGRGGSATQEFVLPVRANAPPQILSTPGYPAVVGQEYVYTAVADDPNVADTVTLTLDDDSFARDMSFTPVAVEATEKSPRRRECCNGKRPLQSNRDARKPII